MQLHETLDPQSVLHLGHTEYSYLCNGVYRIWTAVSFRHNTYICYTKNLIQYSSVKV